MKSILKTLVCAFSFLALAFVAHAQQMPKPQEAAQRVSSKLAFDLNLNETQQREVTQIYTQHFEDISKFKTRGVNPSEIQESRKELHSEMENVLDAQQFEKYAAMEQQREERIRQHKQQMQADQQNAAEQVEDIEREEEE